MGGWTKRGRELDDGFAASPVRDIGRVASTPGLLLNAPLAAVALVLPVVTYSDVPSEAMPLVPQMPPAKAGVAQELTCGVPVVVTPTIQPW